MTSFRDLIRDQVLRRYKVNYLELLAQDSARDRVIISEKFNTDKSVKVLLLTTSVGGLGLTLTGADTVIFCEHDWNPMKDL